MEEDVGFHFFKISKMTILPLINVTINSVDCYNFVFSGKKDQMDQKCVNLGTKSAISKCYRPSMRIGEMSPVIFLHYIMGVFGQTLVLLKKNIIMLAL